MRVTYQTGRAALLAGAAWCAVASAAWAAEAVDFDIAAGDLQAALTAYIDQTGEQLIYRVDDVRGVRTGGVNGRHETDAALEILLKDTQFDVHRDPTGATVIVRTSLLDETHRVQAGGTRLAQVAPSQRRTDARQEPEAAPEAPEEDAIELEEMIVTGTLIRGIAPESSPIIVFDREDIDASGFQSTEAFVNSLPQNAGGSINPRSVGTLPSLSDDGGQNNVAGSSVNLRGLGAGATLTLLNGRRLAPAGALGGFTDISQIPLSAVERVEILTDGASSIYGADAIAGVVNFVLKDDYSGAETQFNIGTVTEGDLVEYRASQLFGTSWGSGNALLSYEYFNVDELAATDKDFAVDAPVPSLLLPGQERHSLLFSLKQDLSSFLRFSVDAGYSRRDAETIFNPGRGPTDGIARSISDNEQYSVSSGLEVDLPADWRLRVGGNYAETSAFIDNVPLNEFANDIVSTNDAALWSADLILDGPVFRLPGGEVRLAVGGEARGEKLDAQAGFSPARSGDRNIYSFFSEAFVPIVGTDNAIPGIRRLEINASVRFDDYSDFGSSTNPKVGLVWQPIDELVIRGSYGTSFKPANLGLVTLVNTQIFILSLPNQASATGLSPTALVAGNQNDLDPEESENLTVGFDLSKDLGSSTLKFSSTYYRIEFDNLITSVPLPFDLIAQRDEIPAELVFQSPSQDFVDQLVATARLGSAALSGLDPVQDFTGLGLIGADGSVDASRIDFLFDLRDTNLAQAITRGIDFSLSWNLESDIGDWSLGVSGNYIIDLIRQAAVTTPKFELVDTIFNPANLRLRGRLGWSHGPWTVSTFVNYTDGYTDDRTATPQAVRSYTTADLNVRYSLGEAGNSWLLSNIDLAFGVFNLFDEDPPRVENDRLISSDTTASYDPANADPRGRFVYFEIRKRW